MSSHDSVFLYAADSAMTAEMIGEMLRDNGIPVFKQYSGVGSVSVLLGNMNAGVDLFVPAATLADAKELVEAFFAVADETEFDDDFDDTGDLAELDGVAEYEGA